MDPRIARTKKRITEAFLKLRARYTPERIKIKDICEIAGINKTTFYKHYVDSSALVEEIDNESVDRVIRAFPRGRSFFDHPEDYVDDVNRAIDSELEHLKLVFRGRTEIFCSKLEERLKRIYGTEKATKKKRVMTSFILGGIVGALGEKIFSQDTEVSDPSDFDDCMSKAVYAILPLLPR